MKRLNATFVTKSELPIGEGGSATFLDLSRTTFALQLDLQTGNPVDPGEDMGFGWRKGVWRGRKDWGSVFTDLDTPFQSGAFIPHARQERWVISGGVKWDVGVAREG